MQGGTVLRLRTLSTVHFLSALAQNAALIESVDPAAVATLGGGGAGISAGKHMKSRVHEIRILSKENLAWAVELWGSATGIAGSDIDLCKFYSRWEFLAADGKKDTADTFYKYWVPGLDLSFQDLDMTGKMHIRLINLSVASKSANAAGAIVVEFGVEVTQGI